MRLWGPEGAAVVAAAIDAGYTHFDAARAYGPGPGPAGAVGTGASEAALAAGLAQRAGKRDGLTVVTKVGMLREGTRWVPDGRARTIRAQTSESVALLGPVDLLLDHAPDGRTERVVTVRALAQEVARGSARAIGLSNPTLPELVAAREHAPIAAVEIALGAFADDAARGGLLAYAGKHGIVVLAHSPFGGPKRARRLKKHALLVELAARRGVSPHALFLRYLVAVGEAHGAALVPLVGASTRASMEDAARARALVLDPSELAQLDAAFAGLRRSREPIGPAREETDVVLVMGIPGAGKSTWVEPLVAAGYERLNRDQRGGTLRDVARGLEERLAAGATKLVLDNTYLTRAARADVLDAARRHRARVRCVHVATPVAVAQARVCERMLERFGELLDADGIARARDPAAVLPLVPARAQRTLEPPDPSEGFDAIETLVPAPRATGRAASGVAVALDALDALDVAELRADAWLLYGWAPELTAADASARAARLGERVGTSVEVRICRHAAGPPRCHCRPPFPGLIVAFARERGVDPTKLTIVGGASARAIASGVGATFVAATATDGPSKVR
jgi:aryl-alcohol dehydrogenase-like predicted oxidoreductase/predicted kinase